MYAHVKKPKENKIRRTGTHKTQENKSNAAAYSSFETKRGSESTFQSVDRRTGAIAQKIRQYAANRSARVKQLGGCRESVRLYSNSIQREIDNSPRLSMQKKQIQTIQRMWSPNHQQITTLADLNTELGNLTPVRAAIGTGDFGGIPGVTNNLLDQAVKQSNLYLYNGIPRVDIINDLSPILQILTAPPKGYTRETNGNFTAYVKDPSNIGYDKQEKNLLVNAAHNLGTARHKTSKAIGAPSKANWYIHKGKRLIACQEKGKHTDGNPKIKLLKEGKVKGTTHRFN